MDAAAEREALRALLDSEGWTILETHLESQYGPVAYATQIDALIAKARQADRSAEQDIGELGAAVRHVNLMRRWPKDRLEQLKAGTKVNLNPFATRKRA
jgi:hypothetical protein